MLAVVEQQQHLRLAEPRGQVIEQARCRRLANVECARDSMWHERRLAEGAEVAPKTPSAKSGSSRDAVSSASRVFPTPPTPVSVTSRPSASNVSTSASSAERPTKLVAGDGRL